MYTEAVRMWVYNLEDVLFRYPDTPVNYLRVIPVGRFYRVNTTQEAF